MRKTTKSVPRPNPKCRTTFHSAMPGNVSMIRPIVCFPLMRFINVHYHVVNLYITSLRMPFFPQDQWRENISAPLSAGIQAGEQYAIVFCCLVSANFDSELDWSNHKWCGETVGVNGAKLSFQVRSHSFAKYALVLDQFCQVAFTIQYFLRVLAVVAATPLWPNWCAYRTINSDIQCELVVNWVEGQDGSYHRTHLLLIVFHQLFERHFHLEKGSAI
jgi:hypothetical protein